MWRRTLKPRRPRAASIFTNGSGMDGRCCFPIPRTSPPVRTTEFGYMARIAHEFTKRGVKIIGLSVEPVDSHTKWALDIKETQGFAPNYPMIGDPDLKVSKLYGMLPAAASGDAIDSHAGRQPDRAQRLRDRAR